MRYLANKTFQKDLNDQKLDDNYLHEVLDDIFKGLTQPLGAKMYKIRAARKGRGKSGGFRNIFYWKKDEIIIFCLLFSKNEKDNLSQDEKKALKLLSEDYSNHTESDINTKIRNKVFKEINYD
jgi:hypothetical protein